MRLLLDTHAFLWFVAGSSRLSTTARAAIEARENERFLSAASIFEMAVKMSLGKLTVGLPIEELLGRELASGGFALLPIEIRHVGQLASLPFYHRDPFDRLLAAQALVDALMFVSADEAFDSYGVQRHW
ncbi:MAG: type II toxin-antitoxin system VapC family toxin [Polyangiaceae bacterium]|nr:type II toxin-antitoxin system VapC family toxin [Polyangiaceae bacterium]